MWFYFIYYPLLVAGFILGLSTAIKKDSRFFLIAVLLGITLLVESFVGGLRVAGKSFVWVYHLYTPFNFILFALFFRQYINSRIIKQLIVLAVIFIFVFNYAVSWQMYQFNSFPGLLITVNGFLLMLICIFYFFNISDDIPFFKNPVVWIAMGVLLYFGGTAYFNGVYTKMLNLEQTKALALFGMINQPLNLVLYSCINIGFICCLRQKKYIYQP